MRKRTRTCLGPDTVAGRLPALAAGSLRLWSRWGVGLVQFKVRMVVDVTGHVEFNVHGVHVPRVLWQGTRQPRLLLMTCE